MRIQKSGERIRPASFFVSTTRRRVPIISPHAADTVHRFGRRCTRLGSQSRELYGTRDFIGQPDAGGNSRYAWHYDGHWKFSITGLGHVTRQRLCLSFSLGGVTLMTRISFPVWLRSAACVWAVLASLWFLSCYHFARGEVRVDGWFINCRPGFEDSFAVFVLVVAVLLLVVVAFVARAIHKRMRHHDNASQPTGSS